jgi:hypothetical protein
MAVIRKLLKFALWNTATAVKGSERIRLSQAKRLNHSAKKKIKKLTFSGSLNKGIPLGTSGKTAHPKQHRTTPHHRSSASRLLSAAESPPWDGTCNGNCMAEWEMNEWMNGVSLERILSTLLSILRLEAKRGRIHRRTANEALDLEEMWFTFYVRTAGQKFKDLKFFTCLKPFFCLQWFQLEPARLQALSAGGQVNIRMALTRIND